MINIKIKNAHKSIPGALEFELPDFTVLCGENGSGKTHLFEAIQNTGTNDVFLLEQKLKNINYIAYNGLNPTIDPKCDSDKITKQIKSTWEQLSQSISQSTNTPRSGLQLTKPEHDPVYKNLHSQPHLRNFLKKVHDITGLMPSKITEDIVADNIGLLNINSRAFFNGQLATIFKTYHVHQIDNDLNELYHTKGMTDARPFLGPENFQTRYGTPPWEFVDSIFEYLNLPYKATNPMGLRRESEFEFKFVGIDNDLEIDTNSLSTGEKTFMSLALAIYNFSLSGEKPDLIIMDEPDAPLHPSMAKLFLEVIQEEIVTKNGVKVLISTHSPTTIALAPAQSVFKITRQDKSPQKCNLDDSLKLIAHSVPNLRVSVEDRRQVFVEHLYDVNYLEKLFTVLSRHHAFQTKPNFLPPNQSTGSNCSDVKNIVNQLRDMGNNQVFGLIDWDLSNSSEDGIIILGMERRYAIENYLLEPHFLGLYLINKGFVSPSEMGLNQISSYVHLCSGLTSELIQKIATWVESQLNIQTDSPLQVESELVNGLKIKYFDYFWNMKGHDLEDKYKDVWPRLNSIRSGDNRTDSDLKVDILRTVINDHSDLLSVDLLNTFKQIT